MTDKTYKELMQQALEALEFFADTAICSADTKMAEEGIAALRAAYIGANLYTAPQKREWQGLTDEEISAISKSIPGGTEVNLAKRLFAREIEDKLKEKNT